MSNFIVPNYDFAPEISASFDQGYSDSSTVHRSPTVDTTDTNGLESGYSVGYKNGRDFHSTAAVVGTDLSQQSRAYRDGYDAASVFHTSNTVSGNDSVGRERGYFDGFKAARSYHTQSTLSGTDATGTGRAYNTGNAAGNTVGYNSGHSAGYSTGNTAGTSTGNTAGYSAGNTAGYSSGNTAGITTGRNQVGRWMVRMPGNQGLGQSTYTKVNFSSTTVAGSVRGCTFNTGLDRIYITQAGVYEIAAGFEITRVGGVQSGTDKLTRASIKVNGSWLRHGDTMWRSAGNGYGMNAVRERRTMQVGDYVEIYAYANFDGTKYIEQVSADSTDAFFIGVREII